MPNKDGNGPKWNVYGAGYGNGCGMHAWHSRYGMHGSYGCRRTGMMGRETLEAQKEYFTQRLAEVEKRLAAE